MSRIVLEDTVMSMVTKMSEGNPGALTVLMELLKAPDIDPDGFAGPVGTILMMDSLGIYGATIWILYKDVCHQEISKVVAVLRAWQLGLLNESVLKTALQTERASDIDVEDLYLKVKARLPNFDNQPAGQDAAIDKG